MCNFSKKKRGRPKSVTKEFILYISYDESLDPPEFLEILERIQATKGRDRKELIKAALLNGSAAIKELIITEDQEVNFLIDDLIANF